MKASIQRLRAELASDWAAFIARLDELSALTESTPAAAFAAQAAVALHHAYGAIEAALMRSARTLEGSVAAGPDWHQALLHSMTLDIESIRPRVLSDASARLMRKLLAFRYFFRHGYAVAWDREQLEALRAHALALRVPLQRDVALLDAFLKTLADSLPS